LVVEEKGSIYRENLWWKLTSGSVCKSEKSKNKNKKRVRCKEDKCSDGIYTCASRNRYIKNVTII
jgi:hypothetical protein